MQIPQLEGPAEGLKTRLARQHFLAAFTTRLGLEEVWFAAAAANAIP